MLSYIIKPRSMQTTEIVIEFLEPVTPSSLEFFLLIFRTQHREILLYIFLDVSELVQRLFYETRFWINSFWLFIRDLDDRRCFFVFLVFDGLADKLVMNGVIFFDVASEKIEDIHQIMMNLSHFGVKYSALVGISRSHHLSHVLVLLPWPPAFSPFLISL